MTNKKFYKTTAEHFILISGKNRVAIDRPSKKRITKSDKEELDKKMCEVVELRKSENGHRVNKDKGD